MQPNHLSIMLQSIGFFFHACLSELKGVTSAVSRRHSHSMSGSRHGASSPSPTAAAMAASEAAKPPPPPPPSSSSSRSNSSFAYENLDKYTPPSPSTEEDGSSGSAAEMVVIEELHGVLTRSSCPFPYFMLVAFEAGSPLRGLLLLLCYPIAAMVGACLSQAMALRLMIFIAMAGLRNSELEGVGKAVLARFYLEDLHPGAFRAMKRFRRRCVLTYFPRLVLEPFLREYLAVDLVLGTELYSFHGFCCGFGPSLLLDGCKKRDALQDALARLHRRDRHSLQEALRHRHRQDQLPQQQHACAASAGSSPSPSPGSSSPPPSPSPSPSPPPKPYLGLSSAAAPYPHCGRTLSLCKEGYVVSAAAEGEAVAREEYEKPLIFHDGRLVRRPTPAAAAAVFLWFPIGMVLAVVRLTAWTLLPYEVSVPMAAMLGVSLRVRGAPPMEGTDDDDDDDDEDEDGDDDHRRHHHRESVDRWEDRGDDDAWKKDDGDAWKKDDDDDDDDDDGGKVDEYRAAEDRVSRPKDDNDRRCDHHHHHHHHHHHRRRRRRSSSRATSGTLYVCTHRTLLDPIFVSVALRRRVTAVTYSLSRLSEALSPIRTVRLARSRAADAATLAAVLARDGDLVICPEGTTCREPYLLRYSALFAEVCDGIVPVGLRADVGMFHGTTARGLKAADPFYFLMNPRPRYEVALLPPLPASATCGAGRRPPVAVANAVQRRLAAAMGYACTRLTRRDKYRALAGHDGLVAGHAPAPAADRKP